jgi:hypothetical protein
MAETDWFKILLGLIVINIISSFIFAGVSAMTAMTATNTVNPGIGDISNAGVGFWWSFLSSIIFLPYTLGAEGYIGWAVLMFFVFVKAGIIVAIYRLANPLA